MSELTCAEVEEATTEYALGILPAPEARAVADHLSGCPACRAEVEQIRAIGDQLLELVPDAEPPVGFDRQVLRAIGSDRRRWRPNRAVLLVAGAAAAIVVVVALGLTVLTGGSGHTPKTYLTAALRQGNSDVGSVWVGGHPRWVTMTVQHAALTGTVTCQLVAADGTATTVGTFRITDGTGTWSAPDPASSSPPVGARLIGPDGTVLATAVFAASEGG